jgi:hypothetical protein
MLRKSALEVRFRASAQPVKLQDWIHMLWPFSTDEELELMMRWAALRQAWSILHIPQERRRDRDLDNRVVTYGELCRLLRDQGYTEAQLRERWHTSMPVDSVTFRCHDDDTNQIYNLVDPKDSSGEVCLGEFVRAQIISEEEVSKLFRTRDLHTPISRETYRNIVHPYLKTTYVTHETKNKMRLEEDAQIESAFRGGLTTNK